MRNNQQKTCVINWGEIWFDRYSSFVIIPIMVNLQFEFTFEGGGKTFFLKGKHILGKKCAVYICICLMSLSLLFSTGCWWRGKAADLYVDAVVLTETGEIEKAVKKLDSAVEANKKFSLAHSMLGRLYQEIKEYDKSAASYEKATKLNPWSFTDLFNLGRVYEITKQFAKAVKVYVRACELKPDHLQAHVGAAKSYYQVKDFDNALVYGERAEQIAPELSDVQKLLGDIYGSQKEHEQAIALYKRALELDSNSPDIMTSLAVAYLRTHRNEPAKELLTTVIKLQPENNKAYKHLGYCYLQLKDIVKAIEHYQKAIEIDEMDWDSHRGLGAAFMFMAVDEDNQDQQQRSEYQKKGIRQWRKSLEINPVQPRHQRLRKLIRQYSTE